MWLLFIMLYKVVLTFKSVDKPLCVTIQIKAIEQYFHVVLLIRLYKVALTCKFVDKKPVCNYPSKSYWAALPHGSNVHTSFVLLL